LTIIIALGILLKGI
jgi:hypothetical protein